MTMKNNILRDIASCPVSQPGALLSSSSEQKGKSRKNLVKIRVKHVQETQVVYRLAGNLWVNKLLSLALSERSQKAFFTGSRDGFSIKSSKHEHAAHIMAPTPHFPGPQQPRHYLSFLEFLSSIYCPLLCAYTHIRDFSLPRNVEFFAPMSASRKNGPFFKTRSSYSSVATHWFTLYLRGSRGADFLASNVRFNL
jgi:hypothetical protein